MKLQQAIAQAKRTGQVDITNHQALAYLRRFAGVGLQSQGVTLMQSIFDCGCDSNETHFTNFTDDDLQATLLEEVRVLDSVLAEIAIVADRTWQLWEGKV